MLHFLKRLKQTLWPLKLQIHFPDLTYLLEILAFCIRRDMESYPTLSQRANSDFSRIILEWVVFFLNHLKNKTLSTELGFLLLLFFMLVCLGHSKKTPACDLFHLGWVSCILCVDWF